MTVFDEGLKAALGAKMTQWELCEFVTGPDHGRAHFYGPGETRETNGLQATRRYLATLARDGWELVSVINLDGLLYHYFKRPAPGLEGEG